MRRFSPVVLGVVAVSVLVGSVAQAQIVFLPGPSSLVPHKPTAVAAGDFDGDGVEDAAIASSGSDKVTIAYGTADNKIGALQDVDVGRGIKEIAVGDLNSDGLPDFVVVSNFRRFVFVVINAGNRTFNQPIGFETGRNARDIAIGNFDGRNGNDIVTADVSIDRVTALLNNGANRGFTSIGEFEVGNAPKRVAAADLNGDGFDDIISVNTGTADADDVSILLNSGVGNFRPPLDFLVGSGAQDLAVADYNSDGVPDIAVLNGGLSNTNAVNIFTVSILLNITANVDGKLIGTGSFEVVRPITVNCPARLDGVPIFCFPNRIVNADFDDDGFQDLAISFQTAPVAGSTGASAGLLSAYAGRGDGTFDFANQIKVGLRPNGLATADYNGDRVPDLAVGEQGSSTIRIVYSLPPPKLHAGDACHVGHQCESGFCVDGVCCGTASCPTGEFCNVPPRVNKGTCSLPANNGTPCDIGQQCASDFCVDGFCCGSRSCPAGQFCNTGDCAPPADNGTQCNAGEQCITTFCVNGFCCNSNRCPFGQRCDVPSLEGQCLAPATDGTQCTVNGQCASGFCTDKACCPVSLCPAGQSCNVSGREGVCSLPPSATPTLTRTATPTRTPTPQPAGRPCGAGSQCTSGFCVDGVCCNSAVCPGGEFCSVSTSNGTCAPKQQSGDHCLVDADCLSNNCQPGTLTCGAVRTPTPTATRTPKAPGDSCVSSAECRSDLNCVETVCCAVSAAGCPAGQSCKVPGLAGQCVRLPTPTPTRMPEGLQCDPNNPDLCDSGFCTNQVCCNSDNCSDNERCDIFGFEGQCTGPLGEGNLCSKNSDCQFGLQCSFDTSTGRLRCLVPPAPTPTLFATAVPTATPAFEVQTSRGGGCSIGDHGDGSGLWVLGAVPLFLWLRRSWLQPERARIAPRTRR